MSDRGSGPRWPSQDFIDRSGDFAIIGVFTARWEELPDPETILAAKQEQWNLSAAFRRELDRAVADSVREVLDAKSLVPRPSEHYQIGPAAEGPPTYIVELWSRAQDLGPVLSGLADAFAVAEITRRVSGKLREWARRVGARHCEPVLILTPYQLAKLCEEHVRRTYHPRARLSVEWFPTTTEFWGGYRSPAHPTSDMEYLVTVRAGRKTYTYAVNGEGRVHAHHLREGGNTVPLQLPSLLSSSGDGA
jgi:hypothetical protein